MKANIYPSSIVSASEPGPAPSGDITYTVRVNLGNGNILDVPGVRPWLKPWWEVYGFDVVALPVGYGCLMVEVGDIWLLFCVELPLVFQCDGMPLPPIVRPRVPELITDRFGNVLSPEMGGGMPGASAGEGVRPDSILPGGPGVKT